MQSGSRNFDLRQSRFIRTVGVRWRFTETVGGRSVASPALRATRSPARFAIQDAAAAIELEAATVEQPPAHDAGLDGLNAAFRRMSVGVIVPWV